MKDLLFESCTDSNLYYQNFKTIVQENATSINNLTSITTLLQIDLDKILNSVKLSLLNNFLLELFKRNFDSPDISSNALFLETQTSMYSLKKFKSKIHSLNYDDQIIFFSDFPSLKPYTLFYLLEKRNGKLDLLNFSIYIGLLDLFTYSKELILMDLTGEECLIKYK